jgi:hypothetical protein
MTNPIAQFQQDFMAFTEALTIPTAAGPTRFEHCIYGFQRERLETLAPSLQALATSAPLTADRHWWEATKGASKDTELAIAVMWLLTFGYRLKPLELSVACANKRDEMGFVRVVKELIALNTWLDASRRDPRAGLVVTQNAITCYRKGMPTNVCRVGTTEAAAVYGVGDLLAINGLSDVPREQAAAGLMDDAAKGQSLVVVATIAGYLDTWQWDWRKMAQEKWAFYEWTQPAPWLEAARLEEIKRRNKPDHFNRIWHGRWCAEPPKKGKDAKTKSVVKPSKMLTAAWTQFRPHPRQIALWLCKKRFVAVPAGRGSGKTQLAKRRLVRHLSPKMRKPWPDARYFFGGPTHDQAKRLAWQDFKNMIPRDWVDWDQDVRESDLKITTRWGTELHVVALDKPQRMEGVQWDGCVLDESCDLKPGVFTRSILPMLTHRKGWCWRIGVPKRQGPSAREFRQFYEQAISGEEPQAAGFTWPSGDIVLPEEVDYARRTMDPKDFMEQFMARFETAGGSVFYAFDEKENVRPCKYHRDRPLAVASDFNVDPMCWVLGHCYENRVEWIDEIWLRNTNTQYTLDRLATMYSEHRGGWEFYGDAAGRARTTSASQSDWRQIYNDGRFDSPTRKKLCYPKANPPIDDRLAACNAMFCNAAGERRMFIDPKCKKLIMDIEDRGYKTGTRDLADTGDVGHITDAMGYAVHRRFPIRIRQPATPRVIVQMR